jgi:hypothetical protein
MKIIIFLLFVFILLSKIIPADLFAQTENKLAVVITSTSPSEENLLKLKGYFTYISKGKEIKKEINKNAWGWNFEGEHIQEVNVTKSGGEGSFQLFIIENDEMIFESGSINTSETVIYKREDKEE